MAQVFMPHTFGRRTQKYAHLAGFGKYTNEQLGIANAYFKTLTSPEEVAAALAYSQLPDAARGSGLSMRPEVAAQKALVLAGDYIGAYGSQWPAMLAAALAGVYDPGNFNLPLQLLPDGGAVPASGSGVTTPAMQKIAENAAGQAASDSAWLTKLYMDAYGRTPDAEGYAYWLGRLAGGESRSQVQADFEASAEYAAHHPGGGGGNGGGGGAGGTGDKKDTGQTSETDFMPWLIGGAVALGGVLLFMGMKR